MILPLPYRRIITIKNLVQCRIITPGIGMPQGTWGIRKLIDMEVVDALDMCSDLIPSTVDVKQLFKSDVIPAKSWAIIGSMIVGTDEVIHFEHPMPADKRLKISTLKPPALGVTQNLLLNKLRVQKNNQLAVKADDAEINTVMWLEHFVDEGGFFFREGERADQVHRISHSMDVMRKYLLAQWKRKICVEYRNFLLGMYPEWKKYRNNIKVSSWVKYTDKCYIWMDDGLASYRQCWKQRLLLSTSEWMKGADALVRALKSSWWEWDDGSAPFYWRWPLWYRAAIRDGIAFPFRRSPPKYMVPQRDVDDPRRKQLVVSKLNKVLDRRYLGKGIVKSLTAFFDVPKGAEDIRMVYDGTVNGFNDCIEVPRFGMPTLRSHLRSMAPGHYMVDADVGECFLNFHLHASLQPFVGVDLTRFIPDGKKRNHWVCWHRAGMGLKSSSYQACQAMMVVEEIVKGDRKHPYNPFRWDKVVCNLPGSRRYDPSKPWVYKIRII